VASALLIRSYRFASSHIIQARSASAAHAQTKHACLEDSCVICKQRYVALLPPVCMILNEEATDLQRWSAGYQGKSQCVMNWKLMEHSYLTYPTPSHKGIQRLNDIQDRKDCCYFASSSTPPDYHSFGQPKPSFNRHNPAHHEQDESWNTSACAWSSHVIQQLPLD
jgi:hypothetical protein